MSIPAYNWAWRASARLNSTEYLVLLALCHCHNGRSQQCNPKIETLSKMTGLSPRPIRYALVTLEKQNLILRLPQRKDARQASNQFDLACNPGFQAAVNCSLIEEDEVSRSAPSSDAEQHPYKEQEYEQESHRSPVAQNRTVVQLPDRPLREAYEDQLHPKRSAIC